jgi:AbiJ N-terminal domain 4
MNFSERMGFVKPRTLLQVEEVDENLKNGLWEAILRFVLRSQTPHRRMPDEIFDYFITEIYLNFLKLTSDDIPQTPAETKSALKNHFYNGEWYKIYDLVEFCLSIYVNNPHAADDKPVFKSQINYILEREKSAYRLIDDKITPISDEVEISSIQETLCLEDKFQSTKQHIQKAITLFSQKPDPDYRNTMKEAISAVEATVVIIVGDNKKAFGAAVKQICNDKKIHPSLREGLLKIYGYTSDGDGIRHCITYEPNLSHADAKFMLVSCCDFCNFLIEKSELE